MPTVLTQTPVTTNFDIVAVAIKMTDLYGSTGAYLGTYSIPNSGVKGCFRVTAPDSTVIYNNTNFSAPDVNGATPLWVKSIAIPTNSDGSLVQGTYTVVYTARITDGSHTTYDVVNTATYNFQYASPTVAITATVDCVSPNFTTVDTTNYVVNSLTPAITRTFTLTFPLGSGGTGTPLTTSTTTISTGTFYQGPQTSTVSSLIVYTVAATGTYPTFAITDTVVGYIVTQVDCTLLCSIHCCIRSLYQKMMNVKGVNDVLFETYTADFNKVMSIYGLALSSIACGSPADVNAYYAEIEAITNCTADCDCGESSSLVIGLGGVSNTTVVTSGGSPVTVTSNVVGSTTTYTVSLSSAFIDIVNSSYNTTLTSDDSSVTIVQTGSNPINYDLSITPAAPLEFIEFQSTINFPAVLATSADVSISVASFVHSGTTFVSITSFALHCDDAANGNWLNLNNAFKMSGFFSGTPNTNYKVFMTSSREGLSGNKNNSALLVPEIYGVDLVAGTFYFRFAQSQPGNPVTVVNSQMAGYKFHVNIKISE